MASSKEGPGVDAPGPPWDQSRVQKAQCLAVCKEQTAGTHQCGRAGGSTSTIILFLLHREKRPTAQIGDRARLCFPIQTF